MFRINRKAIIIASMVLLLLVTGFLNWKYMQTEGEVQKPVSAQQQNGEQTVAAANYFTEFKAKREILRTQEITNIDSIINNTNTDKETLAEAQLMKLELTDIIEKELKIEGLLKAKGFTDVVMAISNESVNVVVQNSELNQSQVAQILEVVRRETGQKAANIKITPTE